MRSLLVTHGKLGCCLLECATRIQGPATGIDVLSNDGMDAPGLAAAIGEWLESEPGEALILVDFAGGSCGTAARLAASDRESTWILGGVNLPMVLTCVSSSDSLSGQQLVAKILDRSLNAVSQLEPLR